MTVQLAAAWCWGAGQCMLDPTCAALAELWPRFRNPWVADAAAPAPQPPPESSHRAGSAPQPGVLITLVADGGTTSVALSHERVMECTSTVARMVEGVRHVT